VINPTLAFVIAAVSSIAVGPVVISLLSRLKLRQTISEDAPERHMKKQGTPTMGGLIILAGAVIGAVAMFAYWRGVWQLGSRIVAVLALIFAHAALGFLDDILIVTRGKNLGLKARHKLLGQFLVAIGFVAWVSAASDQTVISFGSTVFDLGWVYYPLAVLLIVGMSNAVNLTDGLDGLAGGLAGIVAFVLGLLLTDSTSPELAGISYALAGGCSGFLWYNANPAKVFMGDTGSLAIGAGLAGIAIAGKAELPLMMLGSIFVFEALSVTIQVISFKTTGRRVFKMTPIHHHFELCGWPEQRIVTRFWIVQALIAVAVLAWVFK
jgi:phospho-N-acetylmuramoyl-pentapeptide-transferase